jgi:diguanylate cyclase (GGDEF)-like protein
MGDEQPVPPAPSAGAVDPDRPGHALGLADAEFELFSAHGIAQVFEPREVLFLRGEYARLMYVVEAGRIALDFGGGKPGKVVGARESIGELALFIGGHLRTATATALERTVVRVIDQALFEALLQRAPGTVAQFMRRSFGYLVASEQQLIARLRRRNDELLAALDALSETRAQLGTAERLAQTDELTGLLNRRGLDARLADWLRRLPEELAPALLLLDLDRFRLVNDHCGQIAGDRVLQAVAREIEAVAGAGDLVVRLASDEFVLLTGVVDPERLGARARQLATTVASLRVPSQAGEHALAVSIAGVLCDRGCPWRDWLASAESTLYEIKLGGGGDFAIAAAAWAR